jgi:CelD/BcsL family acetyltransferase involved in cellulose biosynthesis
MGSDPATAAFFREWAERAAAHGALQVLSFGLDDKPVAIQCAVRAGSDLHLYKIGSDDAFARHAPGVLLIAAVAEHFGRDTDRAVLDSWTDPGNDHYVGLFPDSRTFVNLAVGVGGLRDRAGLGALVAARDPRVGPRLEPVRAAARRVRALAP